MVGSIFLTCAALLWPARKSTDLFLVATGQLTAASGRDFRTTVWITNLAPSRASVEASFLERHPLKSPVPSIRIDLAPGETREIPDLPVRLQRVGQVGAIRFRSEQPIAVAARIFGSDAIGAALEAVSADAALGKGDEGFIPGVTYDAGGTFRQRTYFVETTGRPAGVFVRLRDAAGRELGHDSFLLEPYEQRALTIAEFARGQFVYSGSLSVRTTGGGGRVYAVGLQIPVRSGDGYFVDMTVHRADQAYGLSAAEISIYVLTALAVVAAIAIRHRDGSADGS